MKFAKNDEGKLVQVNEAENPTKALKELINAFNKMVADIPNNKGMWAGMIGKALNDSNIDIGGKNLVDKIKKEYKK